MRRFDGPRYFGSGGAPIAPARPDDVPAFDPPPRSNCLVDPISMDDTECLKVGIRTDWSLYRRDLDAKQLEAKADMLKSWLLREMLAVTWPDGKSGTPSVPRFAPRKQALLLYCAHDQWAQQLVDLVLNPDTAVQHYRQTLPGNMELQPYPTATSVEAMALARHYVRLDATPRGDYPEANGQVQLILGMGISSSQSVQRASQQLAASVR